MGEIADDMINGACCALCGQYFIDPDTEGESEIYENGYEHGYPVACKDCWEKDCGYQKAKAETF